MPWVDENGQPVDEATAKRADALTSAQDRVRQSKQSEEPGYMQRLGSALKERATDVGTSALHTVKEMGRSALPPFLRDKFKEQATAGEMLSTVGNLTFPLAAAGGAIGGAAGKATGISGAETVGDIAGSIVGGGATPKVRELATQAYKRINPKLEDVANKAAETIGAPSSSLGRRAAVSAKQGLYKQAEGVTDRVPMGDIQNILADAQANASDEAKFLKPYIERLLNKYADTADIPFNEAMEIKQTLAQVAKRAGKSTLPGSNFDMAAGNKAVQAIGDVMGKVNPIEQTAASAAKSVAQTQKLMGAIRSGNPGATMRALIEKDPNFIPDPEKAQQIIKFADQAAKLKGNARTTALGHLARYVIAYGSFRAAETTLHHTMGTMGNPTAGY